jgi:hypothetical protein
MTHSRSVNRFAVGVFDIKRMIPVLALSALVCSALGNPARAQEVEDFEIESLSDRTQSFFDNLTALTKQDNQKAVFDSLLASGPLSSRDEEVTQLVQRYNAIVEKHRGYAGEVERISAKRFGEDLVLLKYLYKAKDYPIIWYITYYRAPSAEGTEVWAVISLRFDTRLELLDVTE